MASTEQRIDRIERLLGDSACTCGGHGSVRVVRFVAPGDPLDEPEPTEERAQPCPVHRGRLRFERFDRIKGEWVECER